MLILTNLIALENQPANYIITGGHFGNTSTVAPINKPYLHQTVTNTMKNMNKTCKPIKDCNNVGIFN